MSVAEEEAKTKEKMRGGMKQVLGIPGFIAIDGIIPTARTSLLLSLPLLLTSSFPILSILLSYRPSRHSSGNLHVNVWSFVCVCVQEVSG